MNIRTSSLNVLALGSCLLLTVGCMETTDRSSGSADVQDPVVRSQGGEDETDMLRNDLDQDSQLDVGTPEQSGIPPATEVPESETSISGEYDSGIPDGAQNDGSTDPAPESQSDVEPQSLE